MSHEEKTRTYGFIKKSNEWILIHERKMCWLCTINNTLVIYFNSYIDVHHTKHIWYPTVMFLKVYLCHCCLYWWVMKRAVYVNEFIIATDKIYTEIGPCNSRHSFIRNTRFTNDMQEVVHHSSDRFSSWVAIIIDDDIHGYEPEYFAPNVDYGRCCWWSRLKLSNNFLVCKFVLIMIVYVHYCLGV